MITASDVLRAIRELREATGTYPTSGDLAAKLNEPPRTVKRRLAVMHERGEVVRGEPRNQPIYMPAESTLEARLLALVTRARREAPALVRDLEALAALAVRQ